MKKLELVLRPEEAAGSINYKTLLRKQHQIPEAEIQNVILVKRAVDARSRQVKIRLWVEVYAAGEVIAPEVPPPAYRNVHDGRPVFIAGCGPAGMFAALRLLEFGLKPVIIERGKDVRSRRRDLAAMNRQGIVNSDSNYCFGEGGAGTYSDGKLYTRSTKRGDVNSVLRAFVQHGAHEDILIDAHPHIGTNLLPAVIASMRETLLSYGAEIHFNTSLAGVIYDSAGVKGIKVYNTSGENQHESFLPCEALILATGHSARNIFEMLHRDRIRIEAKPFAMGVRVEHRQEIIDAQQYHEAVRNPFLPPASYSLTFNEGKKSLYSFCMCPGGIIAPAATGEKEIVVNGWSPSKRNNAFANSGLVVNLEHQDFKPFDSHGELAALKYQENIERKAWEAGGGLLKAPAQRLVDFVENRISTDLPACSYIPGVTSADLREVLPPEISGTLKDGLNYFKSRMKGYYTNEAILVGVESRTSSPVRIPRDPATLMHIDVQGLYPCGEGAGYAGGIVSAAIDGQRCAEQCMLQLKNRS